MRVFVYWNLHKDIWSLRAISGSSKGRVVAYATEIILHDCRYRVSEAGRQRVLREKCKNVHAGVEGTLKSFVGSVTAVGSEIVPATINIEVSSVVGRVTYNPYVGPTFVSNHHTNTWVPVFSAPVVYMGVNRIVKEIPLDKVY